MLTLLLCVFLETYSGYKKPFAELIQFLPSDIRQYFQDLQTEYLVNMQSDTVAETDPTRVTVRRKLMLDCTKAAYMVSLIKKGIFIQISLKLFCVENLWFVPTSKLLSEQPRPSSVDLLVNCVLDSYS